MATCKAIAILERKRAVYAEWIDIARTIRDNLGITINTARYAAMSEAITEIQRARRKRKAKP